MEASNSQFQNVVGNHLISEKIVSYLSFKDMKSVSLAFKALHGMVRGSQKFYKTTALRLTRSLNSEISIDNQLGQLQLSSYSWGMVEFNTTKSAETLMFLENNKKMLEYIEVLILNVDEFEKDFNEDEGQKLLTMIFEKCKKVVELQIALELLKTHDFRHLPQPEFVKGIKSLEIVSLTNYHLPYDHDGISLQNLQHFSDNYQMKLETISIQLSDTDLETCDGLNVSITNLISFNKDTLQSLNFYSIRSCDLGTLGNIVFPNLKCVQIEQIRKEQEVQLVAFLTNQPPLTTLAVTFMQRCLTLFLKYVQKTAQSLQTLKLVASQLETVFDWKFLGKCSNLTEFSIIVKNPGRAEPEEVNATGVSFLAWLPPTVSKVCIRGLLHFWEEQSNLNGHEIRDSQIISLLSQFPCMTQLDIARCKDDAVTNLVVHTIITQMPKIQVLKFSNGPYTEFALTGIEKGQDGVPLRTAVTGPSRLGPVYCPHISTDAVLVSVDHSMLLGLFKGMNADQLEQEVLQNSSFHRLTIRFKAWKDWMMLLKSWLER